MYTHTKHRLFRPWMIGAFVLLLIPLPALAAGITFDPSWQQRIAALVAQLIVWLDLLAWIVFLFLSRLLDPNFIFDAGGTLMLMLNRIWILSRDLMNVVFAIMLIGAAVYTVITANKEFVAAHIKKFLLAVILVNFSWFVPRVIFDIANVAAATVYGIPSLLVDEDSSRACRFRSTTQKAGLQCQQQAPNQWDCQCAMVANAAFFIDDKDVPAFTGQGWDCKLFNIMCIKVVPLDVNAISGHSAVLNGLIVNHARLMSLATVPNTASNNKPGAMMLFIVREVVVLVIHIALLFPLAALTLAFAARIPVLWLTMAFMPFAFLKFFISGEFAEFPEKIWKYFLKAAFLPAIAGIPLTIGFIMVNAGASTTTTLSGVKIKLTDGISDFWELLWLFMTLGVIWVGVFAVLEKMEGLGIGSKQIKGFGETLGSIAVKAPLTLPTIPGVGNILTLPSKMRAINQGLSTNEEGIRGILGGGGTSALADPKPLRESAEKLSSDPGGKLTEVNKHMDALTEALKRRPTDDTGKAERDTAIANAINGLKSNTGVDNINKNNAANSMEIFVKALKGDSPLKGTLESTLNELKKAAKDAAAASS